MLFLFWSVFFFGLSFLVFRGCVKVLSVLGWLILTNFGGPNWVMRISWSQICLLQQHEILSFYGKTGSDGYVVLGPVAFGA